MFASGLFAATSSGKAGLEIDMMLCFEFPRVFYRRIIRANPSARLNSIIDQTTPHSWGNENHL